MNDAFVVLCTNIGKDGYADQFPDLSKPYLPSLDLVCYWFDMTSHYFVNDNLLAKICSDKLLRMTKFKIINN